MTHLSSMNLSRPLAQGGGPLSEPADITWACWPSYRRQTLALGGDHLATFSFSADDAILEAWFEERLGCHFEEVFGGDVVFEGLVWAMRLSYNGVVLIKSLDNLANSVRVMYRTGSAGSDAITSAATDAESIARWGTKEHLEKLTGSYVTSGTADIYRDNLLGRLRQIRASMEEARLGGDRQPGTLQVEVRGYVHTLNWRSLTSATTSTHNANLAITAALAGANFVTAGQIDGNKAQVSQEMANLPAWDRIKQVVELGGAGGRWLAGCYRSRLLDYVAANEVNVQYEQETRSRRRLTFVPGTGEIIPAPLIRPGGVLFVRDLMGAAPVAWPILDDPRALFVGEVEYSRDGAVLKAGSRDEKAHALAISLAATRQRPDASIMPVLPGDSAASRRRVFEQS